MPEPHASRPLRWWWPRLRCSPARKGLVLPALPASHEEHGHCEEEGADNDGVGEALFELVSRINADGVTVLAVEQNIAVIDHADAVLVLEKGRIEFGGRVEDVADRLRREVVAAYLGQEA